jgi:hypothetical protein
VAVVFFVFFVFVFVVFVVVVVGVVVAAYASTCWQQKKKSMQGKCGVQVVEARRNQLALPAKTM